VQTRISEPSISTVAVTPDAGQGFLSRQHVGGASLPRAGAFVKGESMPRAASAVGAPPRPEQALVQRARTGDASAFDALFLRYKDDVYACLWNLLDGDGR